MDSKIGVLVGATALLLCLGGVALMMRTEWAKPESSEGKADAAAKASGGGPKKKAAKKAPKKAATAPKKKVPPKSKK